MTTVAVETTMYSVPAGVPKPACCIRRVISAGAVMSPISFQIPFASSVNWRCRISLASNFLMQDCSVRCHSQPHDHKRTQQHRASNHGCNGLPACRVMELFEPVQSSFSTILNLALLARTLAAISASLGTIGFLLTRQIRATCAGPSEPNPG